MTAETAAERRAPIVLGAADGAILVLGLITGMAITRQPPAAVWHAALSDGLAELIGMGGALWLSNGRKLTPAIACGVASAAGAIIPGIPFTAGSGPLALAISLTLVITVAAVITWLRPEHGIPAIAQTYGLLAAAAILCAAAGLA